MPQPDDNLPLEIARPARPDYAQLARRWFDEVWNHGREASIVHPPVAVLALGFRREQVSHPLDGFGFLTPEVERRRVLGAVFSSTIFPDRAPEGHVMLTTFVGGTRDPDFVQADPQTLTARVLDDLRVLLGAQGEPTFRAVQVDIIPPRGKGKLTARTRNGYFAPGQAAASNSQPSSLASASGQ